jgi:hypothetical protein
MNVGLFLINRRIALLGSIVLAGLGALATAGCGMDLETGYKYRPLGASAVERRGYYASPYSAEKNAAEQEQHKQGTPTLGGAAGN